MTDMYHHGEVLEAICLLCRGTVKLALNCSGGNVVYVGSNRLFSVGDSVELWDDASGPERHQVAQLVGLTQVALEASVEGEFQVARGARISLTEAALPKLNWVGRGRPAVAPSRSVGRFPSVVVEPRRLVQPMGGGTNRAITQSYWNSVYYMRHRAEGEEQEAEVLAEVQALFNLLMSDPYLGGSCWHSQVSSVDYSPEAERELQSRGAAVRVVRLDVVARRSESASSV